MKVKEDFFSNEDFLAKNRVLWEEYNERQVTRLTQKVYVIKNPFYMGTTKVENLQEAIGKYRDQTLWNSFSS